MDAGDFADLIGARLSSRRAKERGSERISDYGTLRRANVVEEEISARDLPVSGKSEIGPRLEFRGTQTQLRVVDVAALIFLSRNYCLIRVDILRRSRNAGGKKKREKAFILLG